MNIPLRAVTTISLFGLVAGAAFADPPRYATISKLTATPANRDALVAGLAKPCKQLKGCISYVVAKDGGDPKVVWVTELWASKADHDAAFQDPQVQAAMQKALPLITSIPEVTVTVPAAAGAGSAPR